MQLKLIIRSLVFLTLLVAVLWGVISHYTQGYVNEYYPKFLNKSPSLVIGTSRALQGIIPDSLIQGLDFDGPMLNFAFTIKSSPFGEVYLNAIKRKVPSETTSGLFIVEVSPFAFAADTSLKRGVNRFRESKLMLGDQCFMNFEPNIEFVLRNYGKPIYELILNDNGGNVNLKTFKNGWLQVTVPMDSVSFNSRLSSTQAFYKKEFSSMEVSEKRKRAFISVLDFLKEKGEVYIVRLPLHNSVHVMENDFFPEFDEYIGTVASNNGLQYINLVSKKYETTDGQHISSSAAKELSSYLRKEHIK